MSGYDKTLTNKMKNHLSKVGVTVNENYVLLEDESLTMMKELFGINDSFYDVFNVKYIVRKYTNNNFSGLSILYKKQRLPIYSMHNSIEFGSPILNGYQTQLSLPYKYVVDEPTNFKKLYPELQTIIKDVTTN